MQLFVLTYIYITKQDIHIYMYVAYSRPNGQTDWADFLCGQSWVAWGCFRLKKSKFFFILFKKKFSTGNAEPFSQLYNIYVYISENAKCFMHSSVLVYVYCKLSLASKFRFLELFSFVDSRYYYSNIVNQVDFKQLNHIKSVTSVNQGTQIWFL